MQARKNAKEHYINVAQRSSASGQEGYIAIQQRSTACCARAQERYINVA